MMYSLLERFEELPSFQSCIKTFGRSILPPVLSLENKNEILHIRAEAVNKEADLAKRRKERLNLSEKVRAVYEKIEKTQYISLSDNLATLSCQNEEDLELRSLIPEISESNISKLGDNYVNESFSTSNDSSSNNYGTFYNNMINCSSVNNNTCEENAQIFNEHAPDCIHDKYSSDYEICNSEDNEIVSHNLHDSIHNDTNVSDNDDCSVLDETDCGSLPTVIFTKQEFCQDTDCESTVTSVAQSTDLEKYMDCSMETSNMSDSSTTIGDGKEITELCSASDDRSSQTVINTESEITPTDSAMAEFQDETLGNLIERETNACGFSVSKLNKFKNKRADSVDSYLNILRLSAKELYGKKSLSDHDISENTEINSVSIVDEINFCNPFESNSNCQKTSKLIPTLSDLLISEVSPQNIHCPLDNYQEVEIEDVPEKTFIPTHIRKNSYTLDKPCHALAQAHADCSCSLSSSKCSSPHSTAIRAASVPLPSNSAAFRKEKVSAPFQLTSKNISILELPGDNIKMRENVSTVLNQPSSANAFEAEHSSLTQEQTRKLTLTNAESNLNGILLSTASKLSEMDISEFHRKAEDIGSMTSDPSVEEELLEKMYCELQESHKRKVEKLLEEQHQQWQKLQLELKQQEKLLCEKIERICTPAFKDNDSDICISVNAGQVNKNKNVKNNENENTKLNSFVCSNFNFNSNLNQTAQDTHVMHCQSDESQMLHFKVKQATLLGSNQVQMNDSNLLDQSNTGITLDFNDFNAENNRVTSENQIHSISSKGHHDLLIQIAKHGPINNSICVETTKTSNGDISESQQVSESPVLKIDVGSNIISCPSFSASTSKNYISPPRANIEIEHSVNNEDVCKTNSLNVENNDDSSLVKNVQFMPVTVALSCIQANKCVVPNRLSSFRSRHQNTNINDPILKKKFEKVSAAVKGYLTRRLYKSEKVQGLIKMLKDTVILLKKMDDDINIKRKEISEHDVEFHRQLIVQLTTIFDQIYNIFCKISKKDQMEIIAESRLLRRNLQQTKTLSPNVPAINIITLKPQCQALNQNPKISSATMKVLERKKVRSSLENRTYTIDDFKTKNNRLRTRSSTLSKSHSTSPTSIYKASVAINAKKKTNAMKSSIGRRSLHPK